MAIKTYTNVIPSLGIYLCRSLLETVAVASAITQRRVFVAAIQKTYFYKSWKELGKWQFKALNHYIKG